MTGPIYRLYVIKAKESVYRLSQEERDELFAKVAEVLPQVGGKEVLHCRSAWAAGDTVGWGVEEFPDIEAIQRLEQCRHDLNWYRYVDSWTLLGTKAH